MAGSGCEDANRVAQVLHQVGGDVDAATEFLIAEQGAEENSVESDKPPCEADTSHDDTESGSYKQENKESKDTLSTPEQSHDWESTGDAKISQLDEKKIPRNKACPCGSKKKYKACCGSVSGRSSPKFPVNQTVDYGKSRKERKQGKKRGVVNAANSHLPEAGPPDVGALCI
ncbi:hypothetical protein NMG60_11008157 [Bertholletia excelsa]